MVQPGTGSSGNSPGSVVAPETAQPGAFTGNSTAGPTPGFLLQPSISNGLGAGNSTQAGAFTGNSTVGPPSGFLSQPSISNGLGAGNSTQPGAFTGNSSWGPASFSLLRHPLQARSE